MKKYSLQQEITLQVANEIHATRRKQVIKALTECDIIVEEKDFNSFIENECEVSKVGDNHYTLAVLNKEIAIHWDDVVNVQLQPDFITGETKFSVTVGKK